jgi:hypothetical protein
MPGNKQENHPARITLAQLKTPRAPLSGTVPGLCPFAILSGEGPAPCVMKELTIHRDECGYWIVTSEKIPGFEARGKTQQEAIEKMKTAFRLYFPCGECKGE